MNGPTGRIFSWLTVRERRGLWASFTFFALLTPAFVRAESPGSGSRGPARSKSERESAAERERERERERQRDGEQDDDEGEEEREAGKTPQEIADEKRRRALAKKGPANAGSPLEQGVHSLARLRVPGPPERRCTGVLVASTTASVMVLTSARCLASASAEPPTGVELAFEGGQPAPAPIVRLDPRYAAAVRAHKPPPAGSDLAVVMAAVSPPQLAVPLFLLDPDRETLATLRERGLALLGFGDRGPVGRTARLEASKAGPSVVVRPRAGACLAADAGGALTAFIPPETYLLGVTSPPSKGGTCEAVLAGADPGARAFLLSLQPLLGLDVKRCTRSAKTAHVRCADLGVNPLPAARQPK